MALRRSIWFGILTLAGLLCVCPSTRAGGKGAAYQCASLVVDGHSGRCASPPLILRPDGTYKIWGEQGTYKVEGRWLKLSGSRKRGRGQLTPGRQIVFDYMYRGRKYTVIFQRRGTLPPGTAAI